MYYIAARGFEIISLLVLKNISLVRCSLSSFSTSKMHFTSPHDHVISSYVFLFSSIMDFCGPESSARYISDLNSVLSINGLLRP